MNLEKIMAISGKPGLYHLTIQTRTGFVVESFSDGKKITVGMKNNVSMLSEISVYTYDGEKPLTEILHTIALKEDCQPCISHKEDNAKLMEYFIEILPDYDQERVYPSDLKKIYNWYNLLQSKGLIDKELPITKKESEIETKETEKV